MAWQVRHWPKPCKKGSLSFHFNCSSPVIWLLTTLCVVFDLDCRCSLLLCITITREYIIPLWRKGWFTWAFNVQSVNVYCYMWTVLTLWALNTRSAAQPIDDDDNVELDKSNVLLMGPTGSGMTLCFLFELVFISALSLLWLFNSILGTNREDITCKDFGSACKCSICHCWCNYTDSGMGCDLA